MPRIAAIGEAMLELSGADQGLWSLGVAGDTLNTAWYLRAGLPESWQVDFVSRVGQDAFSQQIVDFAAEAGIGTAHISRDAERSAGLYAISLQDGERSFSYWRGQSAARRLADDGDALAAAMAGAELVYFSAITLAILAPDRREALVAAAQDCGAKVAFDTNYRPALWENPDVARDWITRAAAAADLVMPSADDEILLFGDASPAATFERYCALGDFEIVVKNGGGSVFFRCGDTAITGEISDLAQVQPVDSTGAGDSFSAGYLTARLTGADAEAAVRAGHLLASRVVQGRGALVP